MASTYSPTLRIELIGDGDQSGIWGQTTNNNLGTLLEQAITGVVTITMTDTNYTLTNYNGVSDEARNAVIVATGTNSAQRDIIAPLVEKIYTIKNSTTGGYAIRIISASGSGVVIPNGVTASVYCDGVSFFPMQVNTIDNQTINGNLSVTGTTSLTGALSASTATFSGAISSVSPTFTGTPTAPTAPAGTNTTQIATTAFVTDVAAALGTMSTQNANNVNITGGNISGVALSSTVSWGAMPAGTRVMFAQAAAPTGWTQVTTDEANNRMLRVVSTAGAGTGGSNSPILNNVVPSHTHGYSTTTGAGGVDHTHGISGSGTTSAQSNDHTHGYSGSTGLESADHAHYTSGTTGAMNSNAWHTHIVSDPGHIHSPLYLNQGSAGAGNGAAWNNLPIQNATHPNGAGSYAAANTTGISIDSTNIDHTHSWGNWSGGVNANHYHSFSGTSGGVSANHTHTWSFSGTSAGASAYSHTHSVSGTTDNGSSQTNWTPRYIDMILCSKN